MKIRLALSLISALGLMSARAACAPLYEGQENLSAKVEERLQANLDKVFGKRKATALVRIEFMLEPKVSQAIKDSLNKPVPRAPAPAAPSKAEAPAEPPKQKPEFTWKGEKTDPASYSLPGFHAKKKTAEESAPPRAAGTGAAGKSGDRHFMYKIRG